MNTRSRRVNRSRRSANSRSSTKSFRQRGANAVRPSCCFSGNSSPAKHPSLPPAPGRPIYLEHEYARTGAWAYIAAWDVHRAKLFGRCERKTGIVPFGRLVAQIMRQQPYRSARRVFWIVDNGSSHRGQRAAARLRAKWPNIILVHTPVHASWLNQIEVYFSIVQRKLLTPNDFANLAALRDQLMRFQQRYQQSAKPFEWTFTRSDLDVLLEKLKQNSHRLAA